MSLDHSRSGGPVSGAEAPATAKPRRTRGPRKSTKEALEREFQRGYDHGINMPRDPWLVLMVVVIAHLCGLGLGAWWF